jgi:hypothetical protein
VGFQAPSHSFPELELDQCVQALNFMCCEFSAESHVFKAKFFGIPFYSCGPELRLFQSRGASNVEHLDRNRKNLNVWLMLKDIWL